MSETKTLSEKVCVPCQGGVPRLDIDKANEMLIEVSGWDLNEDATRISRLFSFSDFVEAENFAKQVGKLAEKEFHHPDISYGWGYCKVLFQTHKILGLHENDFIMAAKVNELEKK